VTSIGEQIEAGLAAIEREEHCVICLAVESGSRAWGFESSDSDAIDELLRAKRFGAELDRGPRVPVISDYVESEITRFTQSASALPVSDGDTGKLDRYFREVLALAWRSAAAIDQDP
jgi:predicted nucleotidyltransferase